MDPEPWFEPKSHGYGAGRPVHRMGWVTLGLYTAGMAVSGLVFTVALPGALGLLKPKTFGVGYTMDPGPLAMVLVLWLVVAVAPMTLWLLVVARAHTRGGWRWRSGGRDAGAP